jgi:hypothetical protein
VLHGFVTTPDQKKKKKVACYEMLQRASDLAGYCKHGNGTLGYIREKPELYVQLINFKTDKL